MTDKPVGVYFLFGFIPIYQFLLTGSISCQMMNCWRYCHRPATLMRSNHICGNVSTLFRAWNLVFNRHQQVMAGLHLPAVIKVSSCLCVSCISLSVLCEVGVVYTTRTGTCQCFRSLYYPGMSFISEFAEYL